MIVHIVHVVMEHCPDPGCDKPVAVEPTQEDAIAAISSICTYRAERANKRRLEKFKEGEAVGRLCSSVDFCQNFKIVDVESPGPILQEND